MVSSQGRDDEFCGGGIAVSLLEGTALGWPDYAVARRQQLDLDSNVLDCPHGHRKRIRHSAEKRLKRESSVSTSYCPRQRVVQFLRDRSPRVNRDKVDVLAEPTVREVGSCERGTSDEVDAVAELLTEISQ